MPGGHFQRRGLSAGRAGPCRKNKAGQVAGSRCSAPDSPDRSGFPGQGRASRYASLSGLLASLAASRPIVAKKAAGGGFLLLR